MQTERKNYLAIRRNRGLNQNEFWSQVGITQSGGSRYENHRNIPKPVAELVRLQHELDIDTRLISSGNADLIRAVIGGTLDAEQLRQAAERFQMLLASMNRAAAEAAELAGNVDKLMTGREG
ncbi:helix-turn-helix transcriptional regulator [Chromobacterium fluminis]|uniref:helix-turn-helix transcriptional regulator n=1 Tax=Chromobacterium fluminis TaxID=3044269 RepID=UPI00197CF004|nr:helix-turn-helix transcriptional regulator [Chromobacterium haemolyticum]